MKSFKKFLFESEAVSTETSVSSNAPVSPTAKVNVVNNVSPPLWEPPPLVPPELTQEWIDDFDRNHPMPEPRDGESPEDYQRRLDEWELRFARHMRRMQKLYLMARRFGPKGLRSDPYDLYPDRPPPPLPTDTEEQSWEFLRDIGVPGPWQDDWNPDPYLTD